LHIQNRILAEFFVSFPNISNIGCSAKLFILLYFCLFLWYCGVYLAVWTMFKRRDKESSVIFRLFGAALGSFVLFFLEVLQVVIIAAAIIIPVRYFLIQPFIVKGASMEPNFQNNDYLIINEVSLFFRDLERGEVVVFQPPSNDEQFYIKRVIGLPGETIEIDNGEVTIKNVAYPNGTLLHEIYLEEYTQGRHSVTLGLDEYYLLGDNRDSSLDSRVIGAIPIDNIVGRVWIRGLPISEIGTFEIPEYSI